MKIYATLYGSQSVSVKSFGMIFCSMVDDLDTILTGTSLLLILAIRVFLHVVNDNVADCSLHCLFIV